MAWGNRFNFGNDRAVGVENDGDKALANTELQTDDQPPSLCSVGCSRLSSKTFGARLTTRIVWSGLPWPAPRAEAASREHPTSVLSEGGDFLLPHAASARGSLTLELVDGAPRATRRFFSLVRLGRRHAPRHRHAA